MAEVLVSGCKTGFPETFPWLVHYPGSATREREEEAVGGSSQVGHFPVVLPRQPSHEPPPELWVRWVYEGGRPVRTGLSPPASCVLWGVDKHVVCRPVPGCGKGGTGLLMIRARSIVGGDAGGASPPCLSSDSRRMRS